MKDLMKAEWFKLSKSRGYKALLLCNAASLFSTLCLVAMGAKGTGYEMYIIDLTYILHHAVIGYLFAAVFLCVEFSNRTFGMSLLCGHSRRKIFLSKAFVFLAGLLLLFFVYTGMTTIVVSIANGFGERISSGTCQNVIFLLFYGVLGYAAMGAVMILVAVVAKRTIVTIGAGIGITYSLLWAETNLSEALLPFLKYTYSYQIGQLPFLGQGFSAGTFMMVMVLTFLLALLAATVIFERMELK